MNKTLHLNLTKKWFDMIIQKLKPEEYREVTDYWRSRICNKEEVYFQTKKESDLMLFKEFDTITFSNGFSKNRPQFEIELKDIQLSTGYEKWGAIKGEIYYVFKLGEILSTNLIYEQDLPEMTDKEYKKWYSKSVVVYGVRMGENVNATTQSVNFSEKYLQTKIELAKNTWKDIDVDEYLKEIRGY